MKSEALSKLIMEKKAKVGVIGLGYVGLPLGIECVKKGFDTLGFDVDEEKIEFLRENKSYIKHIPSENIAQANSTGRFDYTTEFSRMAEPDILLICVPTPLNQYREPDMSYIVNNANIIKQYLRKGQLVVLESTTYPGTTDTLLRNILDESGLTMGEDYFLAFSPEREDPGNIDFSTSTIPKVVGGVDFISGKLATEFYSQIINKAVQVNTAAEAEATKLTENIFRAVNIALVNELKVIFDKMGMDIWEILDAASTKPFGFMRFEPGPGWGGHCIPVDPFYLTWKAREFELSTKFIELAGEVNVTMPKWIVKRLQDALNDRERSVKGSQILMMGMAYKRDIDDTRESPALEIMEIIKGMGARVDFHDPHVPEIPMTRHHQDLAGLKSVELTPEVVASYDAVLIVTDHTAVDYEMLALNARLLLDTRGVYHKKHPHLKDKVLSV